MTITDRVALLVEWLRGEPVVTRVIGALAVSWLAQAGIHLDAQTTLAIATVATAVAAWASRRRVAPAHQVQAKVDAAYKAGTAKARKPR